MVSYLHSAKESCISRNTCARQRKNSDQWTPENQLAVIVESAALNEAEMAEYCRKKGLFAEQIQQWKAAFISGVTASPASPSGQHKATVEQKKGHV